MVFKILYLIHQKWEVRVEWLLLWKCVQFFSSWFNQMQTDLYGQAVSLRHCDNANLNGSVEILSNFNYISYFIYISTWYHWECVSTYFKELDLQSI
jgi:hypothetical protein